MSACALAGWLVAFPQDWSKTDGSPGQQPTGGAAAQLDSLTFGRGIEVPVGSAREQDGGKPRTVFVDTYVDWDYGAVTYLGEDGSIAAIPAPSNWEFRHVQLPGSGGGGGGMVALCFMPGNGMSFLLNGEGEWAPIKEPTGELVVGDYDVTLAIDADRIFAIRFDQFSGRSWSLEDDGWSAIGGNLTGWPDVIAPSEGR